MPSISISLVPDGVEDLSLGSSAICPFVNLPWRNVCSYPVLVLKLSCLFTVKFENSLYIPDANPLSDT